MFAWIKSAMGFNHLLDRFSKLGIKSKPHPSVDKFTIRRTVKEKTPSSIPDTREWDIVGDTHYFINDIEVSEKKFLSKAPQ
uniref:Uncharacterized protein n=1 Tax=viral metagenome TaxID=1070528 RepID=A0A6M3LUE9_9ZZZZ